MFGPNLISTARIRHAFAVKNAVCINMRCQNKYFGLCVLYVDVGRCRQVTLVCSGCRNGTRIHQRHRRDLSALELGALAVREVSRRMTDGLNALFAGVSPAPKHGPQNAVFTIATALDQVRHYCHFLPAPYKSVYLPDKRSV